MPVILNHSNPNEFGVSPRPYHRKRERYYHSQMIDWIIANPGGKLGDLALHVKKAESTVSAIFRSDLFQAALAKRKAEFSARTDLIIQNKLTEVGVKALDSLLAVMEKKRDAMAPETLSQIATGALDRLGYSPNAKPVAPVQVNIQNNNGAPVQPPITASELEESRQLMRQHQAAIAQSPPPDPRAIAPPDAASTKIVEGEVLPPEKGSAPLVPEEE